ncbi:hypothetical protein G4Y79_02225 [Phototrophicus methaneseepsis]|uniref:tetrahydrofolate synthase n=1 Tax=Phototrophicus methaneseepsis TaxID=2710758 RepID=A0A7S8EA70_9CHLR|nr:Mur ligase family protein [Phototrophicus methaneseepsis]QPC83214.1 hypothetical protein G4Y79_02225 [Phototrophicus methaneseepsis]
MRFTTEHDAIAYIFSTRDRMVKIPHGLDENVRDPSITRRMLMRANLNLEGREYVTITGSKGKGSTAALCAKLLQHLGHTVGLLTSPHLITWYERIRVNGRSIPQEDFLRILSDLSPVIDLEASRLEPQQYISPQGILLLIALRYFDEQGVNAAVLEVGRGGRYDDVTMVPNRLALFTPIIIEHAQYLGDTLERIAWHKSGIIDTGSYAYSVPQSREVLDVLQREADVKSAEFYWLSRIDMPEYLGETENGQRMKLGRYGECELSLLGRYQLENAALAVQGVGNMHARLKGIPHGSQEYVDAIRAGLADVRWPGRMHKLQDNPLVIVDGAVNTLSAKSFLDSAEGRLTHPVVTVLGVPQDRDYQAVYELYAQKSDAMVITSSTINPRILFPDEETALTTAQAYISDVQYRDTLPEALEAAYAKAGKEGTVLLGVAQPLVGEAMILWDVDMTQI